MPLCQMCPYNKRVESKTTNNKLRIRMMQTVKPDLPFLLTHNTKLVGIVLEEGKEYDAATNPHGAISGICENGEHLGVKPKEFEFLEAPEWVLKAHGKHEMIRLQAELEKYKAEAEKIPSRCGWYEGIGLECTNKNPYKENYCPCGICPKHKGCSKEDVPESEVEDAADS